MQGNQLLAIRAHAAAARAIRTFRPTISQTTQIRQ